MVPLAEDAREEAVEFLGSVVFTPSLTVVFGHPEAAQGPLLTPPGGPTTPRMQPEGFLTTLECSLRASEVGTDLRAVRRCGTARRDCLPIESANASSWKRNWPCNHRRANGILPD